MQFSLKIYLSIVVALISGNSIGQNLYDNGNSREFADYLFRTGQYDLAAIEIERLIFVDKTDDSLKASLIRSYTLNKQYTVATKRMQAFFPEINKLSAPFSDYYAYNLLADRKIDAAKSFLSSNSSLSTDKMQRYQAFAFLLDHDFKGSEAYLASLPAESQIPLRELSREGYTMKRKSPGLALAMSTIVPGTGRFYTGDWKDAIISMITIGVTGYQAYRGFTIKGSKSAYGWVYGTIATGFYLGNIYGSFSSAKRYNKRKSEKLDQKIDGAFYMAP
jgi:hypothetical protein